MVRKRSTNSLVIFAVGIGVGVTLGILFAPQSGEETRESLQRAGEDAIDTVVSTARKANNRTRQAINDVAGRVAEAAEAGKQAYNDTASALQRSTS